MIDALVQGRLHKAPQTRTASNGRRFATATVRTATKDGTAIFVSVIAFAESAVTALLALEDGDAVALAGELTPKVYQPRDGGDPRPSVDLLAHKVLTEYHVKRRREAVVDKPQHDDATTPEDPSDALPF